MTHLEEYRMHLISCGYISLDIYKLLMNSSVTGIYTDSTYYWIAGDTESSALSDSIDRYMKKKGFSLLKFN